MSQSAQEHQFYQTTIAAAFEDVDLLVPIDEAEAHRRAPHHVPQGPFEELSGRLFERFTDHITPHIESYPGNPEYHWSSTKHGFMVAGRGIARCIGGYNWFYQDKDQAGSLDECRQALLHPQTVRTFITIAKMSNEENRSYELWLGLKSVGSISRPFEFTPTLPAFLPEESRMLYAQGEAEAYGELVTASERPYRECPAIRYLPMIWSSHVEAAEQEGLLAAYLDLPTDNHEAAK